MSNSEGAPDASSKTVQCEGQPHSEGVLASAAGKKIDASSPSPFDDPIQRTKWLIRYIRLRKRRAEDEIARQNELKRRKKDARATLQNARTNLKSTGEEVTRCEQRMEELNADRHRILGSLKEVLSREEQRKRQREAERLQAAKLEEQQRLQQQAMEMAALQQQVKNSQLISLLTGLFTQPDQTAAATRPASSQYQQQMGGGQMVNAHGHHPHHLQHQQPSQQPQISPGALLDSQLFQNMQQQQNQLNAALNFLRQHQAVSGGGGPGPAQHPTLNTALTLPQSIPSPALLQVATSRVPPQSHQQNTGGNRPQPAVTPNTEMFYRTLLAGMMAGKPLPNPPQQPHR